MKKSKVKRIINTAMKKYYKAGLTNTADKVRQEIYDELNRTWK